MPKLRIPEGTTRDLYTNGTVTLYMRRHKDTLSLVMETRGKPAIVMPHAVLSSINYWLGNGPDED